MFAPRIIPRKILNFAFKAQNATKNNSSIKLFLKTDCVKSNYYIASCRSFSTTVSTSNENNAKEAESFSAALPDIIKSLTVPGKHLNDTEACEWIAEVLKCNLAGGKRIRGLTSVTAYKMLEKQEYLTEENIRLAYVLGWCVEIFQAYFLMVDDLMDNSETRRGEPCWHRRPGIGLSAANDASLMLSSMYAIIKDHFHGHDSYRSILETVNEMVLKTSVGQYLDMQTSNGGKPNLSKFSMDRYKNIVKHKTSYYTYQMPVTLALDLARIWHPEVHRQANSILLNIGEFFQIQDDYLDCFGDASITGKVGTDIQEGKCSWLAVLALQRVSQEQRELMEQYYGVKDPKAAETIKALYDQLGLKQIYASYEKECYNLINRQIQQTTCGIPHVFFRDLLNSLYKRNR